MEEIRNDVASLLDPRDPVRLEAEAQAMAHQAGRNQWLSSVDEAERLRGALDSVGRRTLLKSRLLQIPDQDVRDRHRRRVLLVRVAVVLLFVAVASVYTMTDGRRHHRLATLATLAINAHLNERDDSDPRRVFAPTPTGVMPGAGQQVALTLPGVGPELIFVRSKRWFMGTCPAIHRLYNGPHGTVSLFSFRLADAGLVSLPTQDVQPHPEDAPMPPCRVRVWEEGGLGYMLVTDE